MISTKRYTHINKSSTIFKNNKGIPGPKTLSSDTASLPTSLILRAIFCFYCKKKTLQSKYFPFSFLSSLFSRATQERGKPEWEYEVPSYVGRGRSALSRKESACSTRRKQIQAWEPGAIGTWFRSQLQTEQTLPHCPPYTRLCRDKLPPASIRVLCSIQLAWTPGGSPCTMLDFPEIGGEIIWNGIFRGKMLVVRNRNNAVCNPNCPRGIKGTTGIPGFSLSIPHRDGRFPRLRFTGVGLIPAI